METKQPQTPPAEARENIMGTMEINPLLIKLSVPMMISMLVQALYNVVDSVFVSHVSESALTAVSLAFSLQNVMIAVGVGTGVGVNAMLSKSLGEKNQRRANATAENGIFLSLCSFVVFLVIGLTCMKPYFYAQTGDEAIARQGIQYLSVCCIFSLGLFTQTMGEKLLAATGRTVFMHSFGCFASRRAFDQAFMSAAYAKLPVHVIGSDPGVCAAYNGGTHMPFEDCALYMSVPEAVVIDPVDYAQINCLTKKLAESGKFSYMRMIRKGFTTVYGDGSDFEIGKGVTLKEGKDVAIIASGIMVDEALKAQEQLAAEGISAKVIDMFTWKPLDEQLILDSAAECGAIVTAENHQVKVGLGSAVANVVIKNNPVPMEMVGVEDRFGQVGAESFLREEYGLTAAHIVEAAKKAIARKNG